MEQAYKKHPGYLEKRQSLKKEVKNQDKLNAYQLEIQLFRLYQLNELEDERKKLAPAFDFANEDDLTAAQRRHELIQSDSLIRHC